MSVSLSLLAILAEGPAYGLQLKNRFDARTADVWLLNVGQVYATLGRLEREGLVRIRDEARIENQKVYEITETGRARLGEWFARPTEGRPPARDEGVLKLVMAMQSSAATAKAVIQTERRGAVELLQQYTRLKHDAPSDAEVGWRLLLDSLIFQTEARVRWLDACEARLAASADRLSSSQPPSALPEPEATEVPR